MTKVLVLNIANKTWTSIADTVGSNSKTVILTTLAELMWATAEMPRQNKHDLNPGMVIDTMPIEPDADQLC